MRITRRMLLLYIATIKILNVIFIMQWVIPHSSPHRAHSSLEESLASAREESTGIAHPLRRNTGRKLMEEEHQRKGIIYAPGHEPHSHENGTSKDNHYNLTKARQYEIDRIIGNGILYVSIAGITCMFGFFVFTLFVLHTWKVRKMIAQEAYDLVYPVALRSDTTRITEKNFQGICNLYINSKIISVMWIFALSLIIYQTLVLVCPVFMPKWLICTPDPAWLLLMHLPLNIIAVVLLMIAVIYWNYHAVLLHSVITMYSAVFLCMVSFGLASSHEPLCLQTVATQVMFALSVWIFFWPPKISGMASLRDRLAWEKRVLRIHDKVELAQMKEATGSSSFYDVQFNSDSSDREETVKDPISINL